MVFQSRLFSGLKRLKTGLRMAGSKKVEIPSEIQLDHFMKLNKKDAEFLFNTRFQRKRLRGPQAGDNMTLWEYVNQYAKLSLEEKMVLINPKVAVQIADGIQETSDRGPNTIFIDADGGFLFVTEEVMEKRKLFQKCKYFVRDVNLKLLSDRAFQTYLSNDNNVYQEVCTNILQYPSMGQATSGLCATELFKETVNLDHQDWKAKAPPYTLFGTSTHVLIKYLTSRIVTRNSSPFSEFYHGRPEFYFLVTPRTWFHMTMVKDHSILRSFSAIL